MRKLLSVMLATVMLLYAFPVTVYGAGAEQNKPAVLSAANAETDCQ